MKASFVLLSSFFWLTFSFAQPNLAKQEFNFGFEKATAGQSLPDKWFRWGSGYKVTIDTLVKYEGKQSVLIQPEGERAPNAFGCVAYSFPTHYEANQIQVSAYMKLNNVTDGPIGLMIRIDGVSGTVGFENMQSRNIQGTKDWTLYTVRIPFPPEGKKIFIGAILTGKGQLWVDDFQVTLDGKDIREAEVIVPKEYKADLDIEFDNGSNITSIDLTKTKAMNLDILGKVWGYLKYYHPAVARGEYNWDYELFRILPAVLGAKDALERNTVLNAWIVKLGRVEGPGSVPNPREEIKLQPDLPWLNQKVLGTELTSSLKSLSGAQRPEKNYYIDTAKFVGNPIFKNERPYVTMNYPDAGIRLLGLYRYWNIINYYFPYRNLIGENWNDVLPEFIPKFLSAGNELDYKLAVLSLIARVHDTHANIWGADKALEEYRGLRIAPVEITFVEGKAVVTDFLDKARGEKSGLRIGDVIESIDNKPVAKIVAERLPFTAASNYPTQLRDIARNLLRTNKTLLQILYRRGSEKVPTQLETFDRKELYSTAKFQKQDTCFKMVSPDIGYLYPGAIKNEYLPTIMKEVSKAKGLIVDLRCYPKEFIVFTLSEYLQPKRTSFAKFSIGSLSTPGRFTFREGDKVGKDTSVYYKGKVVILINETTQSQAEYTTMALRTVPGATVIGSTTAGADGNVSRFYLPGNIMTMISGIGVYYPDGRETQRIGIVPDIEIKPTLKGVQAGRDEVLEKAINVIHEDNLNQQIDVIKK